MNPAGFARFELLRTLRNRRALFFTFAFPLVLFFVIAGSNSSSGSDFADTGLSAALYYMIGLVAFGGMNAMLATGGRIAAERQLGWNRQLRITPLSPRTYFRVKLAIAYLLSGLTIAVLYVSGISLGVHMPAGRWLEMTGLVLVGLLPFAAMGIFLGHVVSADSVGPAVGGTLSLFALLGGTWFPLGTHGFLHDLGQALPSYWLVQASRVSLGGQGWGATGWLVIAAWTVAFALLSMRAYRRDTARG
jgi:ABC-2 type transport system permease protein